MHTTVSHSRRGTIQTCPRQRISVRLPLATIEELDHLARLHHATRQQVLRQMLAAALISDTPLYPTGPDPTARLRLHAQLTRIRSDELAAYGGPA